MESSDKTWSTGEGNPMNSMKRQKDRTLKDELPRSIGAKYGLSFQSGLEPSPSALEAQSLNHWIVKEVLIFIFSNLITHFQPQWWIKWEMESGGQSCIVLFFYLLLIAFNPWIYLLVFIYPFQRWLNTFNLEYCVPGPLLSLFHVLFKFTDKLKLREVKQLGQSHAVLRW